MGAMVRCLLPESPIIEMVVDGLLTAEEGARGDDDGPGALAEHDVWSTLADFTHMRQTAPAGTSSPWPTCWHTSVSRTAGRRR